MSIQFLILLILLLSFASAQFSTSPTWIGNPYLETNAVEIIGNFEDTSQSGGANITFQQIYSIPPKVAFAIIRYSGNDGLYDQDFFMRTVRVTQSLAQIFVFMQGITNIRVLSIMYLAVHPDFKYHLNTFNDIEANFSSSSLSLSPINQRINQQKVFTNYINYTLLCSKINTNFKYFGNDLTKIKIAVYLSGIFNAVISPDFPQIKFDITADAINNTYFKLQVVVEPLYQIDLLKLSFITMDIANIQTSKQYTIIFVTNRYYFDQDYYIQLEKQFFGDVFIGMLDFNTQSPRCTIDFNLQFDPDNGRIIVKKTAPHPLSGGYLYGGLKSARLTLFYMKTWYCIAPYYYFNLQTDFCDDYCASYLYGNKTAGQCLPCPTGCLGCDSNNPESCTVCDSLKDFRELINGQCQCMQGYFQQNANDVACISCQNIVSQCSRCQLSPNFECLSCSIGWYFNENNVCQKCTMVGCLQCTSASVCTVCDASLNYQLAKNNTCQQCPITCLCDGYYLPILNNFQTEQKYCSTVCGDGLKRQLEECDDGNINDSDGCSSSCRIQQFWSCNQSDQQLTCCIIKQEEMFIKVENIIKSKKQNAFQINLTLFPYLQFLSAQKLKNSLDIYLIGINIERQEITVSNIQKIHIKYFYSSHVQKRQCNITLKISLQQNNNIDCSMTVQASMKFYPESSNNLPLMFFNAETYEKQNIAEYLMDIVVYGSYGIFALSAIPCKIVGLQLFGVLQLAYFSLAQIQNLNLMLVPLLKLSAANGYNPSYLKENLNNSSEKITSIQYKSLFLNNCSVMLGVMLAQVLIGLILYGFAILLSKYVTFLSLTKRLLKQGFLTLLVFNSFNFSFAAGIHFKYASQDQQGYIFNSVAAIGSLVLPLIMIFTLSFTESKQFGQFKNKFKQQKSCQLYFVITIIYRYLLGYFIAVKHNQTLGSLIIIAFSLGFLLYNFTNLPFTSTVHNYRACICHLSQFGILMVANYYESMKANTDLQVKYQIFTPAYLELGLILCTIIVSIIGMFYQVYMFTKNMINGNVGNTFDLVNQVSSQKIKTKSSTKVSQNSGQEKLNSINATSQNIKQVTQFNHFEVLNQNPNNYNRFYVDISN